MTPAEIQARVLYRDQDVIVLDKPAGLAVHAGPNSPDHLELYLPALCYGWSRPPRLAHRLDRDTSGCLVLGRHDKAISRLGKLFMHGRIEKVYWAVVTGAPPGAEGRVDLPLKKITGTGGWRIVVAEDGQAATTLWRHLGSGDGLSWLECRLLSGRTHQIRVHLKALGCPVRGDAYYGPDPAPAFPLHLHARAVSVPALSPGKPSIHVEAPPPAHMRAALAACGWVADAP
ncbi:MAG: RNA pseudouridine synthase [Magnetospirillum sp.]|nr:RNA pseudouridine synthase [Magnetospirillum sp.]